MMSLLMIRGVPDELMMSEGGAPRRGSRVGSEPRLIALRILPRVTLFTQHSERADAGLAGK